MSTTVDERVVSLQFDNKEFEKNVSTTMSTLEKFKQKLNFKGTSKGLEEVSAAASKVDMSGLSKGIETVQAKFSAMQVIGTTALVNITNSAMNAGKRIASALTIDPIKTGLQEYETQINAVQTILANTKSKGSTIDDVNYALDELNRYADQTIYNFTEMTRNIGTFTAAGVDLETSTNAIQGIANLAAVSGSSSQQASTAMYQLSQALAAGRVSLMDWNSVVNAGMGGELFQNALKQTSEELGTGAKAAIEKYGSFRESLTQGEWLTTDVLTETLKKFTSSGANEYIAEMTGLTTDFVNETVEAAKAQYGEAEAVEAAAQMLAEKSGYSQEAIYEALDFARTAQDAATKVKTFTQLWDVLKEAAQSGWTQTWEILIGDFEEAKALLTPIADFLTGIINAMSDARNAVLESAFGKGLSDMLGEVAHFVGPMQEMSDAVGNVAQSVADYGQIVNEIIGGGWGNGEERWSSLAAAGYDWAHAQNLVNEKLGDSTRHATEYSEAQNGVAEAEAGVIEVDSKYLAELARKDEETLRSMGLEEQHIETLKDLEYRADKLNMPIEDFIDNIDMLDGRTLMIEGLKNAFQPILTVFKSLGAAISDAFDPITGNQVYGIIAMFYKFSECLVVSEKDAENLTDTLRGVFAIIDIIASITGGAFKIAFKIVQEVFKALGYVEVDILSITGAVGNAIATFRDWLEEHNLLFIAIEKIVPLLVSFVSAIVKLGKALYNIPIVQNGIKKVVSVFKSFYDTVGKGASKLTDTLGKLDNITFDSIKDAFSSFRETILSACDGITNRFDILPKDMISGFVKGIGSGVKKIGSKMLEIGRAILDTIKDFLGIHSPSTEAIEIMENFIDGIVIGIRNGIQKVIDSAGTIAEPFLNLFEGVDFGKIFAGLATSGIIVSMYKFSSALQALTSPMEGVGSVLESVSGVIEESTKGIAKVIKTSAKVVKSFSKVLSAYAFKINTQGLMNVAKAILILAASVFLISLIDPKRLWESVFVLAVLTAVMLAMAAIVNKMSSQSAIIEKGHIEFSTIQSTLLSMGITILMIAAAAKLLGSMDPDQAKRGFLGLAGVVTAIAAVFWAYGTFVKGKAAQNIDKAGKMMKRMVWTMILMIAVVKMVQLIKKDDILPAVAFVGSFVLLTLAFTKLSTMGGKHISKIAGMMIGMAFAMMLMIGVVKLAGCLNKDDILPAITFAAGFLAFLFILVAITHKFGDGQLAKVGLLLFSVSMTMLIMVGVIALISLISDDNIKRGIGVMVVFGLFIVTMVALLTLTSGGQVAKVGLTLLGMAVAIGILAGVCFLMGFLDVASIAKGILAVGMLSIFLIAMITATEGATDCKGSIMAMAVAIGVMAAAIILLSFIKPEKLVGPVAALGTLMIIFGIMMQLGSNVQSGMGVLIVMVVAIGIMTAAIMILATIPFEQALGGAAALSLLMLAMAGAMFILSTISSSVPQALIGALGVLALCVPLLAFVGILYLMQNIENALSSAKALVLLAATMTLLLIPLTLVGALIAPALLGVVGLLAMCVPLLAFVGILYLMQNIENARTNTLLLIALMTTMTTCLVAVGVVAPLVALGVSAMYSLVGFIVVVGVLAAAIGGLIQAFPSLQTMIDTGIPLMISLAGGLGEMIGAFVGGIAEQLMSTLPSIGTSLSMFMLNAMPFILGAKLIDDGVVTGVTALAKALLVITAADVLSGLTSWFTGGSSFADFGAELAAFGPHLAQFGNAVAGINPDVIQGAANAAKTLAEMASTIPNEGGVAAWFAGENSMAAFGPQMASFGSSLKAFADAVIGIDVESVKMACEAAKAVIDMANNIPNEGGVTAWFAGENSMAAFAPQMVVFGMNLKLYSMMVAGMDVEAIKASCEAGKAITDMANTIPNEGGMKAWFSGDNSMAAFAPQMVDFGEGLKKYATAVNGLDIDSIAGSVTAAKSIVELSKTLPEDKLFKNETTVDEFGEQLPALAKGLASYSKNLSGIDMSALGTSITAIERLVKMAKGLVDFNGDGMKSFGKSLGLIGKDGVDAFINAFKDSTSKVKKAIQSLISDGAKAAKDKNKDYKDSGKKLMTALSDGMKDKKKDVKKAAKGVSSDAADSAGGKTVKDEFKEAGKDMVDGFASGISAQTFKAKAKAKAMAEAALQAAKDALDINSPSKEARKLGYGVPEGLAQGISNMSYLVKDSATGMANTALNTTSRIISNIASLIDSDVDYQPTIRPVVDLSDVESSAGSINGLFGLTPSVGLIGDLNSINGSISARLQNGSNGDVISAIEKLGKSLGGNSGNTYNINGITYDDGSNISNAVSSLVRAARIERRM